MYNSGRSRSRRSGRSRIRQNNNMQNMMFNSKFIVKRIGKEARASAEGMMMK